MAIVAVTILQGRDRATKDRLIARLTDAVVETLEAEPRQVRVVIHEVAGGDYAVAGRPLYPEDR